jgi:hypothetical protein
MKPEDRVSDHGRWTKVPPKRKPAPKPAPKPAATMWDQAGLFTAWQPQPQISRAAASGFKWIALQVGGDTASAVTQARAAGLHAVAWGLAGAPGWTPEADGYIVQIEASDQYTAALALLPTLPAGKPRAVVTTFGGADTPALVAPLAKLADLALVECYLQDDPVHGNIDQMLWQAQQYGWHRALPVIGLYHEVALAQYPTLGARPYSVWLAEEMRDQDWSDCKARNGA